MFPKQNLVRYRTVFGLSGAFDEEVVFKQAKTIVSIAAKISYFQIYEINCIKYSNRWKDANIIWSWNWKNEWMNVKNKIIQKWQG